MIHAKLRGSRLIFHLLPLLLCQACLPGTPSEPKALFPADSLSREIALSIPVETVEVEWERTFETEGFGHLSAVRFNGEKLVVSDIEKGQLRAYQKDGIESSSYQEGIALNYPYLLSASGDKVEIFNAGTASVDWFEAGQLVKSVKMPETDEGESLMYFPSLHEGKIYLKTQPEKGQSVLYKIDASSGEVEEEQTLPGPSWLHRGFLRSDGHEMISVSSFYPAFYRMEYWPRLDSLRLKGFDSPMLARMRARAMGEQDETPLIISSAVQFDSLLWVVNLRPGWSRVDVYNHDGRLLKILEEPIPAEPSQYNTLDIDVRKEGDDYLLALIAVKTFHKTISLEYHSKLSLWRVPGVLAQR